MTSPPPLDSTPGDTYERNTHIIDEALALGVISESLRIAPAPL